MVLESRTCVRGRLNTRRVRELVVVGGGPAGLAATIEARRSGLGVTLIDERPSLGGQIFRQPPAGMRQDPTYRTDRYHRPGCSLISAAEASGAEILTGTAVWGLWDRKVAICREPNDAGLLEATQVILAAGAYDRPVVFPGWTLPGVMTAGGIHTLMKTQRIAPGRRILIAGSGPLLLMFAAQLIRHGAPVSAVLEASPRPGLRAFSRLVGAAWGNLAVLRDGLGYLAELSRRGVPPLYSHVVVRAEGAGQVERAIVARVDGRWRPVPGTERALEVDTVALGYGLFPSVELALLSGCTVRYAEDLGGHVPVRDAWMRTTVRGVLAAGDGCGVGGSEAAEAEGRLAGITASLDAGRITAVEADRRAAPFRARLRQLGRLRAALTAIYRVGSGIYDLVTPETIVCRCEEVSAAAILAAVRTGSDDPNVVKGLTRAGMGLCQGKECSRQVAALRARHRGVGVGEVPLLTPRSPVRPVRIGAIAEDRSDDATADVTG